MKKHWNTIYILLIPVLLFVTGCASKAPSESSAASDASGTAGERPASEVALDVWIISNTPLAEDIFRETAAPYLADRPGTTLDVRVLDWDTAWEEITGAVKTGRGPDVLQLGTTWVPTVAAMGGLLELTERVGEVGGADAFYPASWQTTMIRGQSGVYAVPWFVDARVIYYRKDAFARAGVDAETAFEDWESFREALRRVKESGLEGPMTSALGIPGGNDWNVAHNVWPWIWGAGGDVMDEAGKKAALDSEQALEGVLYYTGLAREGLVESSSLAKNTQQIEADFADGQFAAIIAGPWMWRDLFLPREKGGLAGELTREQVGTAPLPAGPAGRATFVGGSNLAVFKRSAHPEEAWGLIAYLSGDEANLRYAQATGMLPAKAALTLSPESMENGGFDAFAQALQYGRSYPSIPQWGPIETALVTGFRGIWTMITDAPETYSEQAVHSRLSAVSREVDILLQQ